MGLDADRADLSDYFQCLEAYNEDGSSPAVDVDRLKRFREAHRAN